MLLAVDALAAEFRAGRDLINRVLRITATGATEFLDLPKPKP
jgi:hypothetical protein